MCCVGARTETSLSPPCCFPLLYAPLQDRGDVSRLLLCSFLTVAQRKVEFGAFLQCLLTSLFQLTDTGTDKVIVFVGREQPMSSDTSTSISAAWQCDNTKHPRVGVNTYVWIYVKICKVSWFVLQDDVALLVHTQCYCFTLDHSDTTNFYLQGMVSNMKPDLSPLLTSVLPIEAIEVFHMQPLLYILKRGIPESSVLIHQASDFCLLKINICSRRHEVLNIDSVSCFSTETLAPLSGASVCRRCVPL